jgi:hypothetical protein
MKKVVLALVAFLSVGALASVTKIYSVDRDGGSTTVFLGSNGMPQAYGAMTQAPTIRDFLAKSGKFVNACYSGSKKEARKLLDALVSATNDESVTSYENFSEVTSMSSNKSGSIRISVLFSDDSGKHEEWFEFARCD